MTKNMTRIQAGLIECLKECLQELKRINPKARTHTTHKPQSQMDFESLTLANALDPSFDRNLHHTLSPSHHHPPSGKSRGLQTDIKMLRRLLDQLQRDTSVELLCTLHAVRGANARAARSGSREGAAGWLGLAPADAVFKAAAARVYRPAAAAGRARPGRVPGTPNCFAMVLEQPPKWTALLRTLDDLATGTHTPPVNGGL